MKTNPTSKQKFLYNLYWNGTDKSDPYHMTKYSWFMPLIEKGYVRIHNDLCILTVTEKGLEYIESLKLHLPILEDQQTKV